MSSNAELILDRTFVTNLEDHSFLNKETALGVIRAHNERLSPMSRVLRTLLTAICFTTALGVSAHASPRCLKDQKPFALKDDIVSWSMFASPGSECIQGLRWSYMQIYSVLVLKAPTKGKLVIVGSGFRYFADSNSHEADNFTLVVIGKNRHDPGMSVLDIAIKSPVGAEVSEPKGLQQTPLASLQ